MVSLVSYDTTMIFTSDCLSATYTVAVRSSEYDLPPEMLDDLVARTVSSAYGGDGGGSTRRKRGREDDQDEDDY